jgi:hypothetical protein
VTGFRQMRNASAHTSGFASGSRSYRATLGATWLYISFISLIDVRRGPAGQIIAIMVDLEESLLLLLSRRTRIICL